MKLALLTTDNRGPFHEFDKPAPWFGPAPEALLSGLAALPELEVHVLSCIRHRVPAPEKLADNIWFHSLHVPRIGWMRTLYLGCVRAIRARLRALQPDIVHGQGTEHENANGAVYSGFPNVVTIHGPMAELARLGHARAGSFAWLTACLENRALTRAGGVFCNSEYTERLVKHRARRTWRVPNALREEFFLQPVSSARSPKRTLLCAGTVCPNKRQNELLDLAEALHQDGVEFDLQFLGIAARDTPYRARFLDRVQNSPDLSYLGLKSLPEMIEHFDRAWAIVHVAEVESFGLVVAEALSRNVKFFGFNSGGVADIISGVPGAEGFADADWAGLKQALAGWIRSGCPRPAPAAAIMRERYHPNLIARRHLEIYREVLGPKTQ
jgi:glycosyltransferase involved in cell wall biosynthesis